MKNKLYSDADYSRIKKIEDESNPYRSAFRRDYARLIHSPAFRRLQGKTQLYPGHESDFFRNRLTHSLEVAQVAKSIAQKLNAEIDLFKNTENNINIDLVEFAGLAHDIGHPPFGHNGELALDDCMKTWGGFEGNAQTLRLLAVVEKKETLNDTYESINDDGKDVRAGLNLTFRSLAAILKYDKEIPHGRKKKDPLVKGYYCSEQEIVSNIRKSVVPDLNEDRCFKTIECQIMDLADDIAYSTYDLEDGLKGGFINPLSLIQFAAINQSALDRIASKTSETMGERIDKKDVLAALLRIFSMDIAGHLNVMNGDKTIPLDLYQTATLFCTNGYFRTAFTSSLVDRFIDGVKCEPNEEMPALSKVYLSNDIRLQVESLKRVNYEFMIMSPRLKLVQYRGYEIVKEIFLALAKGNGYLLLPQDCRDIFQKLNNSAERYRLICDFIAGMTDRYAVEFFGRLKHGDQSIFKPF